MTRNPDGHVSLLVQFPPPEARAAARRLAALLARETRMTVDPQRGNLELSHVRGHDLRPLTDWLYRRGARSVFVRYQHEGLEPEIAAGAAGAALLH